MSAHPRGSLCTSPILGLLYTAAERFSSLEGVVRTWIKHEEAARVRRDWLAAEPPDSMTTLTQGYPGEGHCPESPILEETVDIRAWKLSAREIWVDIRDTCVTAELSNTKLSLPRIETLGCRRMLQPFDLIPHIVVSPIGVTSVAGRRAVRVRATPRRQEIDVSDPTVWTVADEYELLVDEERGIILGLTAFNKGRAFADEEFLRIRFANALPQRTARWDQIANIVNLLYNAQASFSTVCVSMRSWNQVKEEKRSGWLRRSRKTGRLLAKDYMIRLWVDNPSRFRQESASYEGREVSVYLLDGNVWWHSLSTPPGSYPVYG